MKKYLNISLVYAIGALISDVFYREFTKWNGFQEVTVLGKVHTHLFLLGMVMFMLVALFAQHSNLQEMKTFRVFLWLYNIGVPLTVIMMVVRGITQVLGLPLSTGADASISGIAGIGHILTGVGIILLLLSLRKLGGRRQLV